jgi:hypothetical protein
MGAMLRLNYSTPHLWPKVFNNQSLSLYPKEMHPVKI